jgi:hypothetical protein
MLHQMPGKLRAGHTNEILSPSHGRHDTLKLQRRSDHIPMYRRTSVAPRLHNESMPKMAAQYLTPQSKTCIELLIRTRSLVEHQMRRRTKGLRTRFTSNSRNEALTER